MPSRPRSVFAPSCRWIWDGGDERPVDAYRLFRKSFALRTAPSGASISIAADREYRLWINGRYVGRGPAPNPAAHASVDTHEVGAFLRRGRNAIAVLMYHAGIPTFQTELGRAGLIAQLDAGNAHVVTDRTWRWRDGWWLPTGQQFTLMREHGEHLDLRREPVGWTEAGFSASGRAAGAWRAAAEIGPAGCLPWAALEPRDIPLPDHRATAPLALLFAGGASAAVPPKPEVAPAFAREPSLPLRAGATGNLAALVDAGAGVAEIDARRAGVVVAIDWGREVSGFPELEVDCDAAGAVIDIGYAEGVEPDGRLTVHRQGNHCCDRVTLRRGAQTARIFHHRAFRYLVLTVRGARVRLRPLRLVESGYPVVARGAFSCSDARLTRAWELGRRTMQLCMDQGFMDCPHRERGQYIGDALVEGPVALYSFGDTALTRRFLRQARWCQPDDGLLDPCYPSDWVAWHHERPQPGRTHRNRIPGFGCLWIALVAQHWRATGDRALVKELAPVIDRQFAFFAPLRGADGLLARAAEWNFVDWVTLSPATELACLNLQFLLAARAGEELDAALDRPTPAARASAPLARAFEAAHWDDAAGLYRDGLGVHSIHTNALALLTLDLGDAKARRVADGLLASRAEAIGSPYFEGYALRGLCRWGRHADALARIDEKWGPMIDAGATAFWESYAGQWSLCHAWSCEPTALLSRDVLGIGWRAPERTVRIAPHPCALRWAQGIAPLPCGDVQLRWDVSDAGIALALSTPRDVAIEVDLPAASGAVLVGDDGPLRDATVADGRLRARLRGGAHRLAVRAP